MSRAWKNGSTWRWRKIRAAVLERDGNRCQIKLPGCTTLATCVHHTVSRAVSGDNPDHLVASCRWCNQSTGDPRSAANSDPVPKPSAWW